MAGCEARSKLHIATQETSRHSTVFGEPIRADETSTLRSTVSGVIFSFQTNPTGNQGTVCVNCN